MAVERLEPKIQQLALDLSLEEEREEMLGGADTPEEARRRSEMARVAFEGRNIHPSAPKEEDTAAGWMEDYLKLREAGWSWRVAAYIAWAASPKQGRYPQSQKELATKFLGLRSDRVIYQWRRKNPAIMEVIALMQSAPLFEHRRDVIQALIASASDPDHRSNPDRKLFLELTGDYTPRQMVDMQRTDVVDLSELSEKELDLLAGRLMREDNELKPIGDEEEEG